MHGSCGNKKSIEFQLLTAPNKQRCAASMRGTSGGHHLSEREQNPSWRPKVSVVTGFFLERGMPMATKKHPVLVRIYRIYCGFGERFFRFCYPNKKIHGIFSYIWLTFMVNVGKCTIHGSYAVGIPNLWSKKCGVFVGLVGILDGYDIMCYWGMICLPPNDIFCM